MIATKTHRPHDISGHLIHAVVMSNMHLDTASRAWLDNQAELNRDAHDIGGNHMGGQISTLGTTMCGWFSHAPALAEGNDNEIPAVLAALYRYARAMGCAYILFDADADEIEGLPCYDDDGTEYPSDTPIGAAPLSANEHAESAALAELRSVMDKAVAGNPVYAEPASGMIGSKADIIIPDEIGLPDQHMVTVDYVDGPKKVFAPYGVDMGGEPMQPPMDRPDLPSLEQLERKHLEKKQAAMPMPSLAQLRAAVTSEPHIAPKGTSIQFTEFTQSGRREFDKAGHAVIGRSQAKELLEAAAAILVDIDIEIDSRKHSMNEALWKPLQERAERLREALKPLNG